MKFSELLKDYYNEDVSKTEDIIKEKAEKKQAILKEAFDDAFVSKQTAIYRIQNEFVDDRLAPQNIDKDYLMENMNEIVNDVENMSEGEIRIIINNKIQTSTVVFHLPKVHG